MITLKSLPLAAATLLLLAGTAFAQQEPGAPGAEGTDAEPLWRQLNAPEWALVPIGLCAVATLYLVVVGFRRTSRRRVAPAAHEQSVKALFRQGDYAGAYNFCKDNPSPLTNVLRLGIALLGDGKEAAEERMSAERAKENANLTTYLSYLLAIAVCTPMLGLLGTVIGMIIVLADLGRPDVNGLAAFARATAETLVASAFGLFVAIVAAGAFYYLRNRAAVASLHIRDVISNVFRKMPYESLAGVHLDDEELFAAPPKWLTQSAPPAATQPVR